MTSTTAHNASLYRIAKQLIPGGTQLLSMRPELHAPEVWPAYYQRASGCEIVDLDGRTLLDMSTNGIGACLLGYADPDVTQAVTQRIACGSMCSLNSPDEVRLAQQLVSIHPWPHQVRFARTGGEAVAIAVRIARAATGRDRIAFCGYHGWHDWYLAANIATADALANHLLAGLEPRGVPRALAETALPFRYNELSELHSIVRKHGRQLAAVVIEPTRSCDPLDGFLEGVRQACDESGAALICDEISTGWRLAHGGAHLRYDLQPDLAVFAKALGNGHPIAAILGIARYMDAAQDTFISSTYWTESVGSVAALATIAKLKQYDVPAHVMEIGTRVMQGWQDLGRSHGIPTVASGHPAMAHLEFAHPQAAGLGTLYTVRMLDHHILTGARYYPTLAHSTTHLDRFFQAVDNVFPEIAAAIANQDIENRLRTPVRQSGFQRLTC